MVKNNIATILKLSHKYRKIKQVNTSLLSGAKIDSAKGETNTKTQASK